MEGQPCWGPLLRLLPPAPAVPHVSTCDVGGHDNGKRAQYEASPRCASSVPVPVPPLLLLAPWLGHSLAPLAAELVASVCLALRLAGGARKDVARAPALPNPVGG